MQHEKSKEELSKDVIEFAKKFRSLLIPSAHVLVDTTILLKRLVALSDKVLPVKSYFNMVQQMQRTAFVSRSIAAQIVNQEKLEGKKAQERTSQIMREMQSQGEAAYLSAAIASSPNQGELQEELQKLRQQSQTALTTEDSFVIACAYLGTEVAKQGSVHYLRGESPDFVETKKHRNPLDLTKEVTLKSLSSMLARPDADRGKVEQSQIDSGFNHLARLNHLAMTMLEVVEWIKFCEAENKPCRKIDIRKRFDLSHTDYERVMAMARRAGKHSLKRNKIDPANKYRLNTKMNQRVLEEAQELGYTPQKTLNRILDDFFSLIDYAARMGRSPQQAFTALSQENKKEKNNK